VNFQREQAMNLLASKTLGVMAATVALALLTSSAGAIDAGPVATSAKNLAARLSALREGASYVRVRLEVKQPSNTAKLVLQLQIKERRTKTASDVVYQVLWPKERKGEAVLVHKADGSPASGSLFIPPDKPRPLNASQMNEALFGSDLSYQDIIENFFAWEKQTIVGTEVLNGVSCLILESKPDKGESSSYGGVRSWIDTGRLVPLRVEKYLPSGQLARRIDTIRVAADDKGRPIPADLTVRRPGKDSVTDLDGSRIRHDVAYTDHEFTPEGLTEVLAPPSAAD
jgi:Outer membrane lipoprotein-sorting protein